ncbi:MAG: hypothetical protein WEB09_07510 [Nitriliruptor sp.]
MTPPSVVSYDIEGAAVTSGLFATATSAWAACAAVSQAQHLESADVVFEGRALRGSQAGDGTLLSPARFEMTDLLKGEVPDVVEVTTGTSSQGDGLVMTMSEGIAPRAGEVWRIYAMHAGRDAPLDTSVCSGSVRLTSQEATAETGVATRGSPDHEYRLVAEQVPGFGGAWVEGGHDAGRDGGTLHLWLAEASEEAEGQARALLVELLGAGFDQELVVVHEATFTWIQLHDWFTAVADVHGLPGVVFSDADERINRVVVGVEDPARNERGVRDWLQERSIPQQAVTIVQSDPVRATAGPEPPSESPITGRMLIVMAGFAWALDLLWRRWRTRTGVQPPTG